MGRLFSVLVLSVVMLFPAHREHRDEVQPVFFSMLFPQLIPQCLLDQQEMKEVQL